LNLETSKNPEKHSPANRAPSEKEGSSASY